MYQPERRVMITSWSYERNKEDILIQFEGNTNNLGKATNSEFKITFKYEKKSILKGLDRCV